MHALHWEFFSGNFSSTMIHIEFKKFAAEMFNENDSSLANIEYMYEKAGKVCMYSVFVIGLLT